MTVAFFGLSLQTDAYFAASAIPFVITSTIEAQTPKVFVPFFVRCLEENGRDRTWVYLRSLIAVSGLLLLLVAGLVTAGASAVVPLQVPGLSPATIRLTVELQMILAWTILIQGLAAVMTGFLFADHHYFATTASKFTTNVVTIVVAVLGHTRLGIHALALGVVGGSAAQLVWLLLVARGRGFTLGSAPLRDPKVIGVLRACTYPLLGQVVSESRTFVENFLGSLLGAGALSILRYANRIVSTIAGVLIGGLLTTSLPIVSLYAATGRREEMKEALLRAIRYVALLALPVGLWLAFAGRPFVSFVFERGQFTAADSARLGVLLALLAPYLLFSRVCGVLEVAFYAIGDTRTPLLAIPAFLGTYAVVCATLVSRFNVFAFAVATSVGAIVAAIVMVRLAEQRLGSLPWHASAVFGRRLAIACAMSCGGFLLGSGAASLIGGAGGVASLARLALSTIPGFTIFAAVGVSIELVDQEHIRHLARRSWQIVMERLR